jgi:hypothetical protein
LIKFRIRSRTRLWLNLAASAAFIALAIYGWDLPVETAIGFLVICVVFLMAIIGLGVVAGWLLGRLRKEDEPGE